MKVVSLIVFVERVVNSHVYLWMCTGYMHFKNYSIAVEGIGGGKWIPIQSGSGAYLYEKSHIVMKSTFHTCARLGERDHSISACCSYLVQYGNGALRYLWLTGCFADLPEGWIKKDDGTFFE